MAQTAFIDIDWRDHTTRIEYQWLCEAHTEGHTEGPLLVFLHEGLGSVAMWKSFPEQLCQALGVRGLVYSRPGYGQSSAHPDGVDWPPHFMHEQAHEVLPRLLAALNVTQPPWLLGHSDGASIALLYAAQHACAGVIVLAPHVWVEDLTRESIAQTQQTYENTDLRQRLKPYHAHVDAAFLGWSRIWLHPAFRSWNMQDDLAHIHCPLLAIQGTQDHYGTMAHLQSLQRHAPQTRLCVLDHCGHSPQRDQPQMVQEICVAFFQAHAPQTQAVMPAL